jgi:hypothetical protein
MHGVAKFVMPKAMRLIRLIRLFIDSSVRWLPRRFVLLSLLSTDLIIEFFTIWISSLKGEGELGIGFIAQSFLSHAEESPDAIEGIAIPASVTS